MPKNNLRRIWMPLLLSLFLVSGCQFKRGSSRKAQPFLPEMDKLAVVGFLPAVSPGHESGMVRSHLSGAVFMAEPVPQHVADKLTADLFDRLIKTGKYDLISPSQARGVFLSLISNDVGRDDIEIIQQIGQAFSANGVVIGYIYRWREREGTDYAVRRPASVAFDLYLIRPGDGAVLRKGRFDKTQRSLSENIFDLDTFVKGGGKWMTVEDLADLGLTSLLGKLPMDETMKSE